MPTTPTPPLGDSDRRSLFSNNNDLLKQIVATHALDTKECDVKRVLSIVEEILQLEKPLTVETTAGSPIQTHLETSKEKLLHDSRVPNDKILHSANQNSKIVRVLTYPINTVDSIFKCASRGDSHEVTMDLLKALSSYSWDAKAVITLAAFAINYGEFWLFEDLHIKNPLAKHIATLKDILPVIITTHAEDLKKKFEGVHNLLNAVLKVTRYIIELKELSLLYNTHDSPEITATMVHIPTAVYWINRSILICTYRLPNPSSCDECITSTAEWREITELARKFTAIFDHSQDHLKIFRELIEKKKAEDAYLAFKKLSESAHIDNMKVLRAVIRSRDDILDVLRAMIHSTDDEMPIYDGSKRTNTHSNVLSECQEHLNVLESKNLVLLISDLGLPREDLELVRFIYNQCLIRYNYEVLWLPLLDPEVSGSALVDPIFFDIRNNMPWYSVDHPSLVKPEVIRRFKEEWNFVHEPRLVVLDPRGKLSNVDALPMVWIWGTDAFPLTEARERDLWSGTTWNIALLVNNIGPCFQEWIRDNKVICFYGSEDMDWMRKFTLSARVAAHAANVPLEMFYVGNSNLKDKVRCCPEIIDRGKLGHVFPIQNDYDSILCFWFRLWSMWKSKRKLGMTVENDRIMKEVMDIMTFDRSEQGWAIFSRGNYEITKGNGEKVLTILENYNQWANQVDHPEKFVTVLDKQLRGVHINRLILPGHAGYILQEMYCAECGELMDMYAMYRCCID